MPSTHNSEWLNYTFPQAALTGSATGGSGYTPSTQITPNVALVIDKLAWYRNGATGLKPTHLAIWDVGAQTEIAACATIADDGSTGWQDSLLPTPVTLYPGRRYKLAAYVPSGGQDWGCFVSSLPSSGGGMSWQTVITGYRATGAYGYPNVDDRSDFIRFLDAHQSNASPDPAPSVTDQLAMWLRADGENSHKDTSTLPGLPWTINQKVVDLGTQLGLTRDEVVQIGNETAAITTSLGDGIGANVSTVLSTVNTIASGVAALKDVQVPDVQAASDALAATLQQMNDDLVAWLNGNPTTGRSDLTALRGATAAPGAGWTLADQIDFVKNLYYAVPADAYLVTITAYPDRRFGGTTAAGLWLPRLGWWTPMNGSYAYERKYLEFEHQALEWHGRRMPGLALQCENGTEGTVQAWVYA